MQYEKARLRGLLAGILLISVLLLSPAAIAQQRNFDIPASSAVAALPELARQAGIQIIAPEKQLIGIRTPPLKGLMDVREALRTLLADTDLEVVSDDGRTIVLRPATKPAVPHSAVGAGKIPANDRNAEQLGEVVVTAMHREQRLQDVPAAVSVLTGNQIREQGAQDFRDYLTSIPGVNFTEGNLGDMRVTIRGIGGIGNNPLTGIYLNETPITQSYFSTLDPDIFDINRVEVLKGPQGTLYGAGSMGGTVRLITNKPELDWFGGVAEVGLGSIGHGGWKRHADGVINIPLVDDRVALRVSSGYRKDGGWIDNTYQHKQNVNRVEKKNTHAQVLFQPEEQTSVLLGFLYQGQRHGLRNIQDVDGPDFRIARAFRAHGDSDARLYTLTLKHEFDFANITSATSYLDKTLLDAGDAGGSIRGVIDHFLGINMGANEGIGLRSDNKYKIFTQEIRLASKGTNRFDYVVGAFYSNAKSQVLQVFDFDMAPTAKAVETGSNFYTWSQSFTTHQAAVFGEVTFNLNDFVSFTAGLRAFNYKQGTASHASGTLNGAETFTAAEVSDSSTQKKYEVAFKPTRDNLVYAQASQGYRNGGPTGNFPYAACADSLAELGYTSVPKAYGPDRLWNYEIGSKNTFGGGRAKLNGAVYYIDWTDIQLGATLGCGFGLTINAGQAVSKGFEIETSFELIPRLTITGSVAYNDAVLKHSAPGVRAGDGDPIPNVADWSWHARALYLLEVGDGWNLSISGGVNHVGKQWNAFRSIGPAAMLLDSYTVANARIGVSRGSWTTEIFATNLFDQDVVTQRTIGSIPIETVGRPRTVGITARYAF